MNRPILRCQCGKVGEANVYSTFGSCLHYIAYLCDECNNYRKHKQTSAYKWEMLERKKLANG